MIKTAPQSVCSTLLLAGLALSTAIDDLGYRASLLLTGLVTSFAISRLMLLLRHSKRTLDAYQKYHDRLIKRMVTRTMRCGVFNIGLSFTNNQDLRQWLQLEARATRERIVFLAHHNMLTGLANRFLFTQRLQEALAALPNTQKHIAVLSIDLDGFKTVNNQHGHGVGDQLLAIIARRLTHTLRGRDLVARFGGDEFVVLLHEVGDLNQAIGVAEKVRDAITGVVEFNELSLQVGARIGIALCPEDELHVDTILQYADRQMYAQKRATRLPLESICPNNR